MNEQQAQYLLKNETILSVIKLMDFTSEEISEMSDKVQYMDLKERLSLISSLSQMVLLGVEEANLATILASEEI